jgi:hypothetical protein
MKKNGLFKGLKLEIGMKVLNREWNNLKLFFIGLHLTIVNVAQHYW